MKIAVDLPDGSIELDDNRWAEYANRCDNDSAPPRIAFAATRVVMQPAYASVSHSIHTPGSAEEIAEQVDWPATVRLRERLASYGFGIAEGMDTAQRFSIGWLTARQLIQQTGAMQLPSGFCAGASIDHLPSVSTTSQIVDGVLTQIEMIHRAGGIAVILPIVQLCQLGLDESGYVTTYGDIIRHTHTGPLFLHWLGEMFLPSLKGYFPGDAFRRIMAIDPEKVRGAKLSLLNAGLEIQLRQEFIARDQIMLTGDDFHFGTLIAGQSAGIAEIKRTTQLLGREIGLGDFSHALLGVLDAIPGPVSVALRQLQAGNRSAYDAIMQPCEALGQCLFEAPTPYYKTGLAFLAWLNGWQDNRMLVNHEEHCRDHSHLLRLVRLANVAGAIHDAQIAATRLAEMISGGKC